MSEARDFSREAEALDNCDVESAYARWAPIYDLTFNAVLKPGRRALTAAASRAEGPILDVGVGTGLELPMFEPHTQVFGVDLSEPMLRRCAQRVAREELGHVVGLAKMDATRMAFPDAAFGCVVAPYVLTVVPEPVRTLDEFARVVRPGGTIALVFHVIAETGLRAAGERALAPLATRLGWRPDFPWAVVGDWLARRPDLRLAERRTLPPFSLFTLACIERLR